MIFRCKKIRSSDSVQSIVACFARSAGEFFWRSWAARTADRKERSAQSSMRPCEPSYLGLGLASEISTADNKTATELEKIGKNVECLSSDIYWWNCEVCGWFVLSWKLFCLIWMSWKTLWRCFIRDWNEIIFSIYKSQSTKIS